MVQYANGIITYGDEPTLTITLCEDGRNLEEALPEILKEYKRYVSRVCLKGNISDANMSARIFQSIHDAGLKTCFMPEAKAIEEINPVILDELDYLKTKENTLRKEYSPFGDETVWI